MNEKRKETWFEHDLLNDEDSKYELSLIMKRFDLSEFEAAKFYLQFKTWEELSGLHRTISNINVDGSDNTDAPSHLHYIHEILRENVKFKSSKQIPKSKNSMDKRLKLIEDKLTTLDRGNDSLFLYNQGYVLLTSSDSVNIKYQGLDLLLKSIDCSSFSNQVDLIKSSMELLDYYSTHPPFYAFYKSNIDKFRIIETKIKESPNTDIFSHQLKMINIYLNNKWEM